MYSPTWAAPERDRYRFVKMLALLFVVVLFACWTLASVVSRPSAFQEPLRFTDNGSFQISIFEDLHFGEGIHSDLRLRSNYTD